jgi:hypothetical protein
VCSVVCWANIVPEFGVCGGVAAIATAAVDISKSGVGAAGLAGTGSLPAMAERCLASFAADAFCCAGVAKAAEALAIRVDVGDSNGLRKELCGVCVANHRPRAELACDSSTTAILRQMPGVVCLCRCKAAQ